MATADSNKKKTVVVVNTETGATFILRTNCVGDPSGVAHISSIGACTTSGVNIDSDMRVVPKNNASIALR